MMKSKTNDHQRIKNLSSLAVILSVVALIASSVIIIQYRNLRNDYVILNKKYSETIWSTGEQAISPSFGITVTGMVRDTVGIPQYLPVAEGMQFITISLEIKNLTDTTQLFLPQDHLYVETDQSYRYDLSVVPNVKTPIAGEIEPGSTKSGEVGYSVPADTKFLFLVFEPYRLEASVPVRIDLSEYL